MGRELSRELSHVEVVDLLGAYALDALEGDERAAVDFHAHQCRSCMDEIIDHREVAGLLTPGWAKPPEGLWGKIAAALEEVPPPLNLAPVIAMKPGADVSSTALPRRRNVATGIAATIAIAAVTVVGFLGFRVADDNRVLGKLAIGQHGEELQRSVNAALAEPQARKVSLRSEDGARAAEAVVLNDGTGYLVRSNLPALSADKTYQLWALVGTSRISVGVLGAEARLSSFKMDGNVWALAITEESAGGVESTKKSPVVLGRIESA